MPECPYCQFEDMPVTYPYINRGYDDTLTHIRERHMWETSRPLGQINCYPDYVWTLVEFAIHILNALGLPRDILYSDISKKVVCLCGKPTLQQPVPLSVLVSQHIIYSTGCVHIHLSLSDRSVTSGRSINGGRGRSRLLAAKG